MNRPASLLVVDDNEANRDALSRRLRQHGYAAATAADGMEALTLLPQSSFDLVLLDVEMPGLSGFDVLTQLRASHSRTELPVIMVTARTAGEDLVEALKIGANDYLTKPIDFQVALARIETHLAHRRTVEDLRDSEERYALAVHGANDGLWDWNLDRAGLLVAAVAIDPGSRIERGQRRSQARSPTLPKPSSPMP